jgi:chromosome segregation ATPase
MTDHIVQNEIDKKEIDEQLGMHSNRLDVAETDINEIKAHSQEMDEDVETIKKRLNKIENELRDRKLKDKVTDGRIAVLERQNQELKEKLESKNASKLDAMELEVGNNEGYRTWVVNDTMGIQPERIAMRVAGTPVHVLL